MNIIGKHCKKILYVGLALVIALAAVWSGITPQVRQAQDSNQSIGVGQIILTVGTAQAATATDYTTDGIADDVQFQQALSALPAGGGKIEVLAGTYTFTATVSRAINNVTIAGTGVATRFVYDGGTAIFSAGAQANWVFDDLSTDAGGIDMSTATTWMWRNVTINATNYVLRTPNTTVLPDGTITSTTSNITGTSTAGTFNGSQGTFTTGNVTTLYQNGFQVPTASSVPDYVVGVNTATDDVPGSTGYWAKKGATGQLLSSSSNGSAVMAAVYADMPSVTTWIPAGNPVGTPASLAGKIGSIQFGAGRFTFDSQWTTPAGYQIALIGTLGSSSGSPTYVSALPQPYLGGTEVYFTGTTYPVFNVPPVVPPPATIPATTLNMSNITFVVKNPASAQANTVYAFNCDGWCAGTWDNVYFLSDVATQDGTSPWDNAHIKGLAIRPSSTHDRLQINSITVSGFMDYMATLQASHLHIGTMSLGLGGVAASGDDTYSLRVEWEGLTIDRLHLMGVRGGISGYGMSQSIEVGTLSDEIGSGSLFNGYFPINVDYLQIVHPDSFLSGDLAKASIHRVSYANAAGYGGTVNSKQGRGIGGLDTVSQLLPILGDVRGLWPLFDCTTSTTVTDYSPKGHNATAGVNTNAFTTTPKIKGDSVVYTLATYGQLPTVTDHADFTFGNGSVDSPFSVVFYFKASSFPTDSRYVAKDSGAHLEWSIGSAADGKLYVLLYDDATGGILKRYYNTGLSTGTDYIVVATYDGSSAIGGLKLYLNGVRVDDGSYVGGSYTAMSDTTAKVGIGCTSDGTHMMAGDVSWVIVTAKDLSAAESWKVTQLIASALELPYITGNAGFTESDSSILSGATMPTAAVVGQQFYQNTTGRDWIYSYNGTAWLPTQALGPSTIYIDATDGTDDQNHGTGIDAAAYASIQYAWEQIPPEMSHKTTVYLSGETFNEDFWLTGKGKANQIENYSVDFYGTLTTSLDTTATGGTNGSAAGHTQVNGAFAPNAYNGKIIEFTSGANDGTRRLVGQTTATRLWLEGDPLPAAPQNLDTYKIYDWATTIAGTAGGNTVTDTGHILFQDIAFSDASAGTCVLAVWGGALIDLNSVKVIQNTQTYGLCIGGAGGVISRNSYYQGTAQGGTALVETEMAGFFESIGDRYYQGHIAIYSQLGSNARVYAGGEFEDNDYGVFAAIGSPIDTRVGVSVKTYVHGHDNVGVQASSHGYVIVGGGNTYGVKLDGSADANIDNEDADATSFSYITP